VPKNEPIKRLYREPEPFKPVTPPENIMLVRQAPLAHGVSKLTSSISHAVGFAVTKINKMIESVKGKIRLLKTNVS
jgi:hypothetical protein